MSRRREPEGDSTHHTVSNLEKNPDYLQTRLHKIEQELREAEMEISHLKAKLSNVERESNQREYTQMKQIEELRRENRELKSVNQSLAMMSASDPPPQTQMAASTSNGQYQQNTNIIPASISNNHIINQLGSSLAGSTSSASQSNLTSASNPDSAAVQKLVPLLVKFKETITSLKCKVDEQNVKVRSMEQQLKSANVAGAIPKRPSFPQLYETNRMATGPGPSLSTHLTLNQSDFSLRNPESNLSTSSGSYPRERYTSNVNPPYMNIKPDDPPLTLHSNDVETNPELHFSIQQSSGAGPVGGMREAQEGSENLYENQLFGGAIPKSFEVSSQHRRPPLKVTRRYSDVKEEPFVMVETPRHNQTASMMMHPSDAQIHNIQQQGPNALTQLTQPLPEDNTGMDFTYQDPSPSRTGANTVRCSTCNTLFDKEPAHIYMQHVLACADNYEETPEHQSAVYENHEMDHNAGVPTLLPEAERVCPVCDARFDIDAIPQTEFEQHVYGHFAEEDMRDTDYVVQ